MSLVRYFAATALSAAAALPVRAEDYTPAAPAYSLTAQECLSEATELMTLVVAYAIPETRAHLIDEKNCVTTLQYRLAREGSYQPFTSADNEYNLDIASHVDGRFGDETTQAMARFILREGLADNQPEINAQLEQEAPPIVNEIMSGLISSLPAEEILVVESLRANLFRDRAIELGNQHNRAGAMGYSYCVMHEAQNSGESFSYYERLMEDWQYTFGDRIDMFCDGMIENLPPEVQDEAKEGARMRLTAMLKQWKESTPQTERIERNSCLRQGSYTFTDHCWEYNI